MSLPVQDPTLIWICRMCTKMARAKDSGTDECGVPDCFGPTRGGYFSGYEGPLTTLRRDYCYRCGCVSGLVLNVDGKGEVGICKICYEKTFSKKEDV
jgi:hypothetical protein